MNEILNMLLNSGAVEGLASQAGLDQNAVKGIVEQVLPQFFDQLNQNTQDETQANELDQAIEKHDGNSLMDLLNNIANVDAQDGNKINNRVFGSSVDGIASHIGAQLGLDAKQTQTVMDLLSPIIMQFLGKTANETNNRGNNLVDLTSQLANAFGTESNEAGQGNELLDVILSMFK